MSAHALVLVLQLAAASQAPKEGPQAAPAATLQKVEVTGSNAATARRRASTASKIVIDREELQRYGDTELGSVLRRLPGVTLGGRPGRGGDIRMRGLGGGYTLILIDGAAAPAGFNVEQLSPDQVERIEIFRAPTAETGARAVAGVINIILREPLAKTTHELRLGAGGDHGEPQADFNWTRNVKWWDEALVGALNLSGNLMQRFNDLDVESRSETLASGALRGQSAQRGDSLTKTRSLNANGRLRWKLNERSSFHASPVAFVNRSSSRTRMTASGFSSFDTVTGEGSSFSDLLRLNLNMLRLAAAPTPGAQPAATMATAHRIELRGGLGRHRSGNDNQRLERRQGVLTRTQDDHTRTVDDNLSLGGKWSAQTAREHQWVTGLEWEGSDRQQTRTTLENGAPKTGFEEFGDELSARTRRVALYTQDEWSPNKQWSAYAGLRWEGITTEGDAGGVLGREVNRSRVASPLLHVLYKPEAWPKDQLRLSLTRSYRAPNLNDLIARPVVNASYPHGPNPQTSADRAGNPGLKPELATGLDLSWEHWLASGGILMVSGHARRIEGVIRNLLAQEAVPWDTSPRWVSRPRNLDRATTAGLELELKARVDDLWADAPAAWAPLLLRANLAVFESKVDGIPGPNNRLEQQPRGTLNLGMDYRWSRSPLGPLNTGFNWGYVPGGTLQQTPILQRLDNQRSVWDAYLQWSSGSTRDGINWRLSLANLLPQDTVVLTQVQADGVRSRTRDRKRTFAVWNLRAEMRF